MHGLEDKTKKPDIEELSRFTRNPLFDDAMKVVRIRRESK